MVKLAILIDNLPVKGVLCLTVVVKRSHFSNIPGRNLSLVGVDKNNKISSLFFWWVISCYQTASQAVVFVGYIDNIKIQVTFPEITFP